MKTGLLPASNHYSGTFNTLQQSGFYVDDALGDDSNSGGIHSPFKTIMRAVMAADETNSPGADSIHIRPGYYQEFVNIEDDDPLNIKGLGVNPWDVVINSRFVEPQ